MPSKRTVDRAIKTLDGVIEIARNEQLVQGNYISFGIENPELHEKGSICGGKTACLIGSLWISGGTRIPTEETLYSWEDDGTSNSKVVKSFEIEGFDEDDRTAYMRNRPHLRLAYNTLNEVARRYADKHNISLANEFSEARFASDAEGLFENGLRGYGYNEVRDVVIKVCQLAKNQIRRDARKAERREAVQVAA